jgi:adenylate cyclase
MGELLTPADLEALVLCSGELAAEISLDRLLDLVLDHSARLTKSLDGGVLLFDGRHRGLYFAAASGDNRPMLLESWGEQSPARIPIEPTAEQLLKEPGKKWGSVAGQVWDTRQAVVIQRVEKTTAHFKSVDDNTRSTTRSMICVPLLCGHECLGVVQLRNSDDGEYSDRDQLLLQQFGAIAAVAVRNARMFERLLAHMGYYASRDAGRTALDLIAGLHQPAKSERLTILFADMRGFTQLCQLASSPDEIRILLSEFLGALAREVLAQRGIVNKVIGDGLLALFRDGDHAARAVRAAFAMVAGVDALKAQWVDRTNFSLDFLDVGIGLVTDTVILGTVGIEGQVSDFTAIGTPVVLAARFQESARNGQRILADRMTFNAVQDVVVADPPEQIELKKPGQRLGKTFYQYHLRSLKNVDAPAAIGQAPVEAVAAGRGVFISYSHQDKAWLEQLRNHLKPYLRGQKVEVWDDTRINAGQLWRQEIEQALESACVAVLLVSPSFLASDFIVNEELPRLFERARRRGVVIQWVAVSASAWDQTEIQHYQGTNSPDQPLDSLSLSAQNQALVAICRQIKEAIARCAV